MSLRKALALGAALFTLAFGAAAQQAPAVPYERLQPAQPTDVPAGKIATVTGFGKTFLPSHTVDDAV